MALNNGSYGGYNNNGNNGFGNNQQSDEKHSWRIGKDIYANDSRFSVGLFESGYKTPFCSFQILVSIGKDPTTGRASYEQRPPQDIPSVLITHENLEALIDVLTDKTRPTKDREFFPNWIDPTNVNLTLDCGYNSKLVITGSPTEVKFHIEKEGKGERNGTLTGIQIGNSINFATWRILLQKLYYVLAYMSCAGIDAEKFSAAMGSTTGITMTPSENIVDDDLPI